MKRTPLFLDPTRIPVFLYLPNLIGYVRAICLAIAMKNGPSSTVSLYLLFASFALDYFDGPCARYFNMCSKFGDLLDHFLDHITMFYLVLVTSGSDINIFLNFIANIVVALGYMLYYGHYFKHASDSNIVTRLVEEGNYWNLPSLLWSCNCIIIPFIKLSYHTEMGLGIKASTPLLDLADGLGLVVTVSYTAACLLGGEKSAGVKEKAGGWKSPRRQ